MVSEFRQSILEDTDDFFTGDYQVILGRSIPDSEHIVFGKNGKEIELAMLFIDIKESTKIVDAFRLKTVARMYQSFLRGVTKIALKNNGEVKSFNGDGVLVVFYGGSKCNNAVRAALQMMDFVEHVLKAKLQNYFLRNRQLQNLNFSCGIGIDMGKVLVVKAGARGNSNNDLVWVGNPTNYAVKLSPPSESKTTDTEGRSRKVIYNIHITNRVYSKLKPDLKTIKTGFFPRAIWQKQPLGLGTLFTKTSSATVVYRTNQTLPF